jgi:hypothetical protein
VKIAGRESYEQHAAPVLNITEKLSAAAMPTTQQQHYHHHHLLKAYSPLPLPIIPFPVVLFLSFCNHPQYIDCPEPDIQ